MIIVKTLQSTLVNKEKEIWICGGVMLKQQSTKKKKCSIVFNMKNNVIMKNHWRGYGVLSDNVWVINALPPLRHPLPHHLPAICFLTQLHLSLFIYFFWLHPWHSEVPGPGTESELQLQPMPQLQPCEIASPTAPQWDSSISFSYFPTSIIFVQVLSYMDYYKILLVEFWALFVHFPSICHSFIQEILLGMYFMPWAHFWVLEMWL